MQGRVACEVNAGNELVTTELVFAGVLSGLSPAEAVAVLSALVFQVIIIINIYSWISFSSFVEA